MPADAGDEWIDLCGLTEVEEEEPFFTQGGGRELMVTRVGEEISVFTDSCPHIGASMDPPTRIFSVMSRRSMGIGFW
jgi:nitrite reductase/ring-hydroxylating ferredoxin subunit